MGKIKNKMLQDMNIRGFSKSTIKTYSTYAERLVLYYNKPPLEITLGEINRFQHYLKSDCHYSWPTYNLHVCAIRFLYNITLGKKYLIEHIPFHKRPKKLPVILDKSEIQIICKSINKLYHKALFFTLYSCGIRVSELVNIKLNHVDSKRMLIYIENSKGDKDRYVSLPPKLLILLRQYYKSLTSPSSIYLFAGKNNSKPVNTRTVQTIIKGLAVNAGIKKNVTPHILRHSYATHMLEAGVDIKKIQLILGHSSLKTTSGYLHVVSNYLNSVGSPIDTMEVGNETA